MAKLEVTISPEIVAAALWEMTREEQVNAIKHLFSLGEKRLIVNQATFVVEACMESTDQDLYDFCSIVEDFKKNKVVMNNEELIRRVTEVFST